MRTASFALHFGIVWLALALTALVTHPGWRVLL